MFILRVSGSFLYFSPISPLLLSFVHLSFPVVFPNLSRPLLLSFLPKLISIFRFFWFTPPIFALQTKCRDYLQPDLHLPWKSLINIENSLPYCPKSTFYHRFWENIVYFSIVLFPVCLSAFYCPLSIDVMPEKCFYWGTLIVKKVTGFNNVSSGVVTIFYFSKFYRHFAPFIALHLSIRPANSQLFINSDLEGHFAVSILTILPNSN